MKFAEISLEYGLALAPMAGFSDYAMRRISFEWGAEYSVTEMISAKATVYGDKKTLRLARITKKEAPTALQIFGSEPAVMGEAAAILSKSGEGDALPVAIDINMGCPVHKIYSNGEGSALMKNPDQIYDITKAAVTYAELPVTVKLRLGIDSEHINALECAIAAEEAGASALTVHGRTRAQLYSGKADMSEVRRVCEGVRIPVFANGDISSAEDAVRVLSETGADGVMIGRGAIGNPFIFAEIKARLSGAEFLQPTLAMRKTAALTQLGYAVSEKGEAVAVREARGQLSRYFHSFRGSAELRAKINKAESALEIEKILNEFN